MKVTVTAVNALEHAREIKELFAAHERPEFAAFFDRAYPAAVAAGGTSWIGRDAAGRLVMHIACFPRRFRLGQRDGVGGLLVNLMVDRDHRSFFPALGLVRRLVEDMRKRGDVDFLYADPNEESQALLRGTRFERVGVLGRYVLPVGDRRRPLDVAMRVGLACLRFATARLHGGHGATHPAARFDAEAWGTPPSKTPALTAYHDAALYAGRLPGYPSEHDWWFTWHDNGAGSRALLALLLRGPDDAGVATVRAVRPGRDGDMPPLAPAVPALATELRQRGCLRLQASAMDGSNLARALLRSGFVARRERVPLFALALTPLGEACVRAVPNWDMTDLECDR